MGHMLSSMNPEAAARLANAERLDDVEESGADTPPHVDIPHVAEEVGEVPMDEPVAFEELPPVGSTVQYVARPGILRLGRVQPDHYAAVVAGVEEDGSLQLIVMFDAADFRDETKVLPYSDANTFHCWKPVGPQPQPAPFMIQHPEAGNLRDEVAKLRQQVFGGWGEPAAALCDILAEFEQRMKAVEQKAAEAVLQAEAAATAKVGGGKAARKGR